MEWLNLSNVHFNFPYALVLGAFAFLAYLAIRKWHTKYRAPILVRNTVLQRFPNHTGKWLKTLEWIAVIGIFTFGSIVLAEPVRNMSETKRQSNGIDIVLVLDVSKSMLAEDLKPNRIAAAKKIIAEFVQKRTDDRMGLVIFAGKPFASIPLTFDTAGFGALLEKISPDSIRQEIPGLSGTAIGDWLLLALENLRPKPNPDAPAEVEPENGQQREAVIILLTDGEANVGINPKLTIPLLKEKNIKTYSIGIGDTDTELYTTNADGTKSYFTDTNGVPIRARVDEKLLREISDSTGGNYQGAKNTDSLERIFQSLDQLTKRPVDRSAIEYQVPLYRLPLTLLLISATMFEFARYRRRKAIVMNQ